MVLIILAIIYEFNAFFGILLVHPQRFSSSLSVQIIERCQKYSRETTPLEKSEQLLIQEAMAIIENDNLDFIFSEVVYRVGLSSKSNFSKIFKDRSGITPSDIRKSQNGSI